MPSLIRTLLRPHPEYFGFTMRVAYTLMALLVSVLLARLLGPVPLGRYYEVVAWVLLVSTIVQSGWAAFLGREVAALLETRRFAELRGLTRAALRIVGASSLATTILFVGITFYTADRETFHLALAGAPIILLLSTSSVRQAITRGMGRPLFGQICENLARPGVQLLGLALLASGIIAVRPGPLEAMLVFLAAIASSAVLAFVLQKPLMREADSDEPTVLPPRSEWMGPFVRTAVTVWAQAINLQIGTLVVAAMSTDVEIAHFRIAQQLSLLLSFGLSVVAPLYLNDFSRLFVREDRDGLERLAAKGALISGLTAVAIGLIFLIGGESLLARVYGSAFAPAFAPLAVLIVGQLIYAIVGPLGALAIATRNERFGMHAYLWSVAANILLCLVLVPRWGAVGAAAAAAASLALWGIALFAALRRRLGINMFASTWIRKSPGRL